MKNSLLFLATIFMLNSCVELPNLLPNGSGEDSDMVIVEYNSLLAHLTDDDDFIHVDDALSVNFQFNGSGCIGSTNLKIVNGNILTEVGLEPTFKFSSAGDLVGGIVEGVWSNNVPFSSIQDLFWVCLTTYYIPDDVDAVVGIRFKDDDNKWRYGWMVFYLDTSTGNRKIYLKAVGYNKQPGTNVRIGG